MLRHAGIGTYIRNVVPRVVERRSDWHFTLLVPRNAEQFHRWSALANVTVVPCDSHIYSLAEQFELPARTPRRASLFWAPHYNIPLLSRVPLVVTIHDVAHLALADMYGGALRQIYARRMFAAVRTR